MSVFGVTLLSEIGVRSAKLRDGAHKLFDECGLFLLVALGGFDIASADTRNSSLSAPIRM